MSDGISYYDHNFDDIENTMETDLEKNHQRLVKRLSDAFDQSRMFDEST